MTLPDTDTKLCAVIGNPVEHSLSPCMHNAAFHARGLNFVYLAFLVQDVGACLAGMRALPSFRGLSVTIPHKVSVMDHLDEVEAIARHIGCVNTVTNEYGRLIGSSTDGPGALEALADAGVSLEGKAVLFLGSGGAVRAVAFAAAELAAPKQVTILGRTLEHVEELVGDLEDKTTVRVFGGEIAPNFRDVIEASDVIIQGTSIGMYPNSGATLVPAEWLQPRHAVFDMVYRPYKTRFLEDAERKGCTIVQGVEMLVRQAVLQFERWTGVEAPYAVMREAVVRALTREAA